MNNGISKINSKIALLIALGCMSGLVSHADSAYNNDLIVGFTTGSGNDVLLDLGSPASLTDGETWNLNSANLISGFILPNTRWGVIGVNGPTTGANIFSYNSQRFVYTTSVSTPPNIPSKTLWSGLLGTLQSAYQYFPAAGVGNSLTIAASDTESWYSLTTSDVSSSQGFQAPYVDPNIYSTSSIAFYRAVATNGTPTQIGTFTLNASRVLTYNVYSVSSSSTNAYLTSLVLNPAGLTSTFVSNNFSYLATNAYNNMPTVTVVNADLTATNKLIYGGTTNPLASSVASSGLALTLGVTNVVKVQVTAQDGVTVNTYQVNVIELPNLATAPKLTNSVNSGKLILSWPADRLGFRLLVQTNNLAKGISSNTNDWATVPGSTAMTTNSIPIVSTNNGFYRLVYP